jgi:hypothetical protein
LLEGLSGTTPQASKIASAIEEGGLKVNLLGDELFEKAFRKKGGTGDSGVAFAIGESLYLRKSSASILSDAVHEGTHGLDYLRGFAGGTYQWEKRAFFFERQFQLWTGMEPEYSTVAGMLHFLYIAY